MGDVWKHFLCTESSKYFAGRFGCSHLERPHQTFSLELHEQTRNGLMEYQLTLCSHWMNIRITDLLSEGWKRFEEVLDLAPPISESKARVQLHSKSWNMVTTIRLAHFELPYVWAWMFWVISKSNSITINLQTWRLGYWGCLNECKFDFHHQFNFSNH